MVTPAYIAYLIAQEHIRARLREAERDRLIHLALEDRSGARRLHDRALIWLGRRLVLLGKRLQRQAPLAMDRGALQTTEHCRC